jgi:hypothetical protein
MIRLIFMLNAKEPFEEVNRCASYIIGDSHTVSISYMMSSIGYRLLVCLTSCLFNLSRRHAVTNSIVFHRQNADITEPRTLLLWNQFISNSLRHNFKESYNTGTLTRAMYTYWSSGRALYSVQAALMPQTFVRFHSTPTYFVYDLPKKAAG